MNLPNLEIFDNVPSKIFLETIAKGVTGRMNINLGEIAEVSGYYADNKLRIEPLTSFALIDSLTILPDMETVIDSLPPVVKDIRNAKITYTPASGNLLVSLTIDSLVILPPKLLVLEEITILLDTSVSGISAQEMSDDDVYKSYTKELHAKFQTMPFNALVIKCKWSVLGTQFHMYVDYNKHSVTFNIT